MVPTKEGKMKVAWLEKTVETKMPTMTAMTVVMMSKSGMNTMIVMNQDWLLCLKICCHVQQRLLEEY